MSNQEIKKNSLLPPIYGWQSEIAGRTVEVTIDQERLKQDFFTEGRTRGYDPEILQQLASALSVDTKEMEDSNELAKTNVFLVAHLRRSLFRVSFNYPTASDYDPGLGSPVVCNERLGFFHREKRLKRISTQTPNEAIALNVRTRLEEHWRHERAHLMYVFTLNPEEYLEWVNKNKETKKAISDSLFWLRWGATFLPSLVDFALTRHIHLLFAGISFLTSWLITQEIKGRMDFLVYRADPDEEQAHQEQFDTGNLSGIFDVRIVNEC